jgi:hypothetical protein
VSTSIVSWWATNRRKTCRRTNRTMMAAFMFLPQYYMRKERGRNPKLSVP